MKSLNQTLMREQKLRHELLSQITLYSSGHVREPVHNLQTLFLFKKIEDAFKSEDKEKFIDSLQEFIINDKGKYSSEYGKAKDHLESLVSYNNKHNKFRITTHEIFSGFNISEKNILNLGINKTSRTDSVTKIFEYLTSEAIKDKYVYVKDVIVCAPGKIKVPYYNGTKQPKFDLLVTIKDLEGNIVNIGFDHKVKDLSSCIKDIENHGFKYSIFTLGDIEDQIFYESPAVKQQLLNHNYNEVYNNNNINTKNSILEKVLVSETASVIASKDVNNTSIGIKQIISNINEYEKTKDMSIMLKTPLIPTMLCNNKDLAKVIVELTTKRKSNGFGIDFSDNFN